MLNKRARKNDLLAVCPDCEKSFRSYSPNLQTALFYHKQMKNCCKLQAPTEQRFDVCDTVDYMDGFESFRYEDVPLNSLEPPAGALFMPDHVQPGLVMNQNADHAMSDTSSLPDMFMRRETRSLSQRLTGILCNIRAKLNC